MERAVAGCRRTRVGDARKPGAREGAGSRKSADRAERHCSAPTRLPFSAGAGRQRECWCSCCRHHPRGHRRAGDVSSGREGRRVSGGSGGQACVRHVRKQKNERLGVGKKEEIPGKGGRSSRGCWVVLPLLFFIFLAHILSIRSPVFLHVLPCARMGSRFVFFPHHNSPSTGEKSRV